MEAGTGDSIEILVHTSAPSRGPDDARYRALASAYLHFEPASRCSLADMEVAAELEQPRVPHQADGSTVEVEPRQHRVLSPSQDSAYGEFISEDAPGQSVNHVISYSQEIPSRRHRYLTRSSMRASMDSQQASFASVLDNANSPAIGAIANMIQTPPKAVLQAGQNASWRTPPSVVLDSQSTYDKAIPELSSPTKFFELYMQQISSVGEEPIQTAGSYCQEAVVRQTSPSCPSSLQGSPSASIVGGLPVMESPSFDSLKDVEVENFSSDSPRVTFRQTQQTRRANTLTGNCLAETVQVSSSAPGGSQASSIPLMNADAFPSLHKRKRSITLTSASPLAETHHISSSPSIISNLPSSSVFSSSSSITQQQYKKRRTSQPPFHPNQIMPPPPPTSASNLSPDAPPLTPELRKLATKLNLSSRYKPRQQTRPLRPLERGYWRVPTASWGTTSMRDHCWNDLRDFVATGRAGWGVWCTRDAELEDSMAVISGAGRKPRLRGPARRVVTDDWRVYCWGGIVDHIWLLIYLVSQRRLKNSCAEWVDADAEVVVVMR